MEFGIPSGQEIKMHQVAQQQAIVAKNLQLALEKAEDADTDPEVLKWRYQLKAVEKGLLRLMYEVHC